MAEVLKQTLYTAMGRRRCSQARAYHPHMHCNGSHEIRCQCQMTPWFMLECHHYSFTPAVPNQILCIAVIYLVGFGVITSDSLEEGFRCVDRKFFVPRVRCICITC